MKAMMASGGYPLTIIPVENCTVYMHAPEEASVGEGIAPFADYAKEESGTSIKKLRESAVGGTLAAEHC